MKSKCMAMVVMAVVAALPAQAEKQKFVVTKNLTGNSLGGDLCNDVARMLRDSGYTRSNTCHWRFQPNGPNAQSPKWTPVDIRKHPEWVRDIAMMYTPGGLTLTPAEVDARWNNADIGVKLKSQKKNNKPKSESQQIAEAKSRALAELQSGRYQYEEAVFDINGDEKADRVLARSEVNCNSSEKYENPGGRVLFVVDSSGRMNMRSRGSRSYNPFYFEGRIYLLERSYRSLGSSVEGRRADKNTRNSSAIGGAPDDLIYVGIGGSPPDNWRSQNYQGRGEFSFFPLCHITYKE
jgi:hypothetical protein